MSKRESSDTDSRMGAKRQRTSGPDATALLAVANNLNALLQSIQDLKSWSNGNDSQHNPSAIQYENLALLEKLGQDILPSLTEPASQPTQPSPVAKLLPLPRLLLDSPWVSSEIPDELPPLPRIKDPKTEQQVFRHPAVLREGPSYERLEWLGDAFLEAISSGFILATFPDLSSGRCSQIRERLICNRQLAEYFRSYDLMPRAKIPPEVRQSAKSAQGRSSDKDIIKVQADMFEAYVGGIIEADLEFGMHIACQWLKGVWGRTIKASIVDQEKKSARRTQDQVRFNETKPKEDKLPNPSQNKVEDQSSNPMITGHAKEKLGLAIAVPGVTIKYEDIPCKKLAHRTKLPLFAIKVTLWGHGEAGLCLGMGTALGKKEAGAKAAEQALSNWKRISKYRDAKRAYLEKTGQTEDAERLMSRTRHLDERKQ